MNKLAILLLVGAVAMPGQAGAMPTTFGPVVGNALLCVDDIDPAYFRRYLTDFLQPPYKTEGAAYWFKADTTLLGVKISDVFVSTEKTRYAFIGAVLADFDFIATFLRAQRGLHAVNSTCGLLPVRVHP